MNILVVGAEGLLGSCLMQVLAPDLMQQQWSVIGLGKSALDITDYAAVELVLEQRRPDIIINASAYTAVEYAESNILTANTVNNLAVRNLARMAKRFNAVLIHFSTDYVFDGRQVQPYLESDAAHPLNSYGKTKLAGELAVMEEAAKYFIIRTSWLFGADGNNFFSKMLVLLHSATELNIVNDQVGGPTYVKDLVAVVVAILSKCCGGDALPWGVYHYAGYPFVSRYEFAVAIQAALPGRHSCLLRPVTSDAYPSVVVRPLNSCLNSSCVETLLGVKPSDWQAAISSLVALRGI